MTDWLLIAVAVAALWALWGVLNIVFDMLERWNAGRRAEATSSDRERGSFSL